MSNWKPIKDAPHDGTVIDLWRRGAPLTMTSRITNIAWINGNWVDREGDKVSLYCNIETISHYKLITTPND